MKKLSIILFLILAFNSYSQDCDITVTAPQGLPACPGDIIALSVFESDTLSYLWTPGGDTLNEILVSPQETTTYTVEVTGEEAYYCSSLVVIEVHPKINIEFDQLQLTCPGDSNCQAQVKASATGAFDPDEYQYIWTSFVSPTDSTIAVGLCGNKATTITVVDPYGCEKDSSFRPETFRLPEIEMFSDPKDTVYLQKPYVDFWFDNLSMDTLGLTNWVWDFGDSSNTSNQQMPTHRYTKVNDSLLFVKLTITDDHGCDTVYTMPYHVLPVKLFLPNVFTPNGDPYNQNLVFTVEDDRGDPKPVNFYYQSNELVVFNRYGKKVYETTDYENDWDGENLPEGVYYYVLTCFGEFRTDVFKGSLTLLR
ncbi:MAG: gliding motility-associated C-terminal domain-containing protein [Bacteroidales bacterium]|nr:gliding motility-associated C-terminal domain-containing protein [Bacteroidales bacterium]MCF8386534.1 gliding motility-associated C-terminal domain-containing protein [Bacteroidales bacterium]MCF8398597.1 gliding motility-associated C-terminal domain-containing protein [Bacteroidales bacterium]